MPALDSQEKPDAVANASSNRCGDNKRSSRRRRARISLTLIRFAKACHLAWPNNALRHSYATYRLALTADAARVALEMGNSPQKLIRHYRELAGEKEAAAWFAISPAVNSIEADACAPVGRKLKD